MIKSLSILQILFSANLVYGRELWSADLFEISHVPLVKGQPILVPPHLKKVQLCQLIGTIYSGTFSQIHNVTELRICRSDIQHIEPGALCSSPSVKTLELDFYDSPKVPHLKKEMFQNCSNIEELLFKFNPHKNETVRIDTDTFEDLSNLKKLHVLGYKIGSLSKTTLSLLNTGLTTLAFSFCNIRDINPDAFEEFTDLEKVALRHNRKLKRVPLGLFKNNPKLKVLILRSNSIENLTWDEFKGLNHLEQLDLGENKITSFDTGKVDQIAKNLPNLKTLYIELNPMTCKQKEAFVVELKKKLKNVDVTYKFDPGFYDSCEEEIG